MAPLTPENVVVNSVFEGFDTATKVAQKIQLLTKIIEKNGKNLLPKHKKRYNKIMMEYTQYLIKLNTFTAFVKGKTTNIKRRVQRRMPVVETDFSSIMRTQDFEVLMQHVQHIATRVNRLIRDINHEPTYDSNLIGMFLGAACLGGGAILIIVGGLVLAPLTGGVSIAIAGGLTAAEIGAGVVCVTTGVALAATGVGLMLFGNVKKRAIKKIISELEVLTNNVKRCETHLTQITAFSQQEILLEGRNEAELTTARQEVLGDCAQIIAHCNACIALYPNLLC